MKEVYNSETIQCKELLRKTAKTYYKKGTLKTNENIQDALITWLITSSPSFGHEKNCQVEHYFPTNFLCRVIKGWLSTALSVVSRLFRSFTLPPSILNAGRQLVIFKCPTQLKPQICYLFLTSSQQQKNLIRK